jgi:hypothetical protein
MKDRKTLTTQTGARCLQIIADQGKVRRGVSGWVSIFRTERRGS